MLLLLVSVHFRVVCCQYVVNIATITADMKQQQLTITAV